MVVFPILFLYICYMKEIWENIKNTNYSISNFGNLKFLGFKIYYGSGNIVIEEELIINPLINKQGYKEYMIKDFNDKSIYHKSMCIPIHRLVATAFLKKLVNTNVVNHIDGNKLNNYSTNLEWTTISENTKHAINTGLISKKTGFKNGKTILKKDHIFDINNFIDKGLSYKEIEEHLGFSNGYIQTKRSNSKKRIRGLSSQIKPDYTSPRFKNAHQNFVDSVNDFIKKGYKDKEIENFLSLPVSYITEMRRLKKFKKFNILPANRHKVLNKIMIKIIKSEIIDGMTCKIFVKKYQVDRTIYYRIKNNTYN